MNLQARAQRRSPAHLGLSTRAAVAALSTLAKKLILSSPGHCQFPSFRIEGQPGSSLSARRRARQLKSIRFSTYRNFRANSSEISTYKLKEFKRPEISTYRKDSRALFDREIALHAKRHDTQALNDLNFARAATLGCSFLSALSACASLACLCRRRIACRFAKAKMNALS